MGYVSFREGILQKKKNKLSGPRRVPKIPPEFFGSRCRPKNTFHLAVNLKYIETCRCI